MSEQLTQQLTDEQRARVHIVSGQVYPELAEATAAWLGVKVQPVELSPFADGESYVRHEASVRRKSVYVFQSHLQTPGFALDSAIFQQRLLIRAAKEADADEVTAVIPYTAYSRQDRKSRNREATSSAVMLQDYETARADRLMTFDLHAPQAQAFFRGVCVHLTAFFEHNRVMKEIVQTKDPDDFVVVAPDTGRANVARAHANHLGVRMCVIYKSRDPKVRGRIESVELIGEVKGKTCLIPEDIVGTGTTLAEDGQALLKAGAESVLAFVTHGQFSPGSEKKLGRDTPLAGIWVTDTLPQADNKGRIYGLEVLSIAPILGETILKIETGQSITTVYDDHKSR